MVGGWAGEEAEDVRVVSQLTSLPIFAISDFVLDGRLSLAESSRKAESWKTSKTLFALRVAMSWSRTLSSAAGSEIEFSAVMRTAKNMLFRGEEEGSMEEEEEEEGSLEEEEGSLSLLLLSSSRRKRGEAAGVSTNTLSSLSLLTNSSRTVFRRNTSWR